MSADRELTRIVRSWLQTDEHESADRVLDVIIGRLDTTPQRRPFWLAWRSHLMKTTLNLAVGAAVVLAAAVVGINLLPAADRMGGGGAGAPSASSSGRPTDSPPSLSDGLRSVSVGTVSLSLTMPFTWETHDYYFSKNTVGPQGAEAILFLATFPEGGEPKFATSQASPVAPFIACTELLGSSDRATVDDLAAAVSSVPGTDLVSGPADATVGGQAAKQVVLFVTYSALDVETCGPGFFYSWTADDDGAMWTNTIPGDTIRVWIVDVDGTLLFIEAETHWNAGSEVNEEIEQIVGSIRFE